MALWFTISGSGSAVTTADSGFTISYFQVQTCMHKSPEPEECMKSKQAALEGVLEVDRVHPNTQTLKRSCFEASGFGGS